MILENVTFCGNGKNEVFLPKNAVLQSISAYSSAYEMLSAETVLSDLDEDFESFLQGFDDYEGFTYYVFNNEICIVTDGFNVCSVETLDSVLPNIEKYYREEWLS